MPVLPLRDVVVYPNMVVPLFVGRTKSIKSLEDAMNNNDKTIMLVTQLSADINDPVESEVIAARTGKMINGTFVKDTDNE